MSDHNVAKLRTKLHILKRKALRYKLSFQDDIFYEDKEHATGKNFQLATLSQFVHNMSHVKMVQITRIITLMFHMISTDRGGSPIRSASRFSSRLLW